MFVRKQGYKHAVFINDYLLIYSKNNLFLTKAIKNYILLLKKTRTKYGVVSFLFWES